MSSLNSMSDVEGSSETQGSSILASIGESVRLQDSKQLRENLEGLLRLVSDVAGHLDRYREGNVYDFVVEGIMSKKFNSEPLCLEGGTSGQRIYFFPEVRDSTPKFFMKYPKPGKADRFYGGDYYDAFVKIFNFDTVEVSG